MGRYLLLVEYADLTGEWHTSAPVSFNAKSERKAVDGAVARADSLFPAIASRVVIRVVSAGAKARQITEIPRPISN